MIGMAYWVALRKAVDIWLCLFILLDTHWSICEHGVG